MLEASPSRRKTRLASVEWIRGANALGGRKKSMLPKASARKNAEHAASAPGPADIDDLVFEGRTASFDADLAWEWDRFDAGDA
jgi:hypothetical protein